MNRIGKYEGVVRLVLLLVVLPAAVYRLSLGRTVALWGEVRRTERTLAEAEAAPVQPDASVAMLDTVELIAGGGLLDLLERFDPDSSVRIVSYTPYLTRKGDDFTLRSATADPRRGGAGTLRLPFAFFGVQNGPPGTADLAAVDPRCPATDR